MSDNELRNKRLKRTAHSDVRQFRRSVRMPKRAIARNMRLVTIETWKVRLENRAIHIARSQRWLVEAGLEPGLCYLCDCKLDSESWECPGCGAT